MAEVRTLEEESVPQQEPKTIEQVEGADLVVGVLAELSQEAIAQVCNDLRALPGNPRTVVLHTRPFPSSDLASSKAAVQDSSVLLLPLILREQGLPEEPFEGVSAAYGSIFAVSEKLGARGCCVIASQLEHAPPKWVCQLTRPLLEGGFDLVAPRYALRKFEGLLNRSIIAPLTASLYGKRIRNPMGPDFGISQRLLQTLLRTGTQNGERRTGLSLLASLAPRAVCDGLQICQAHIGARVYPPVDWAGVSSLLSEVLGPIFLGIEKSAACWQRTRSSVPVKTMNEPVLAPEPAVNVEIGRLVSSFQRGVRDLQEIWGLVLPPATLLEIRKLSRLPVEQHHVPDELWARIVYDFALAHHLRTMNRDHLLRSLTPLYAGWVASYARDVEAADIGAVEERLERLAMAFETGRPYIISRWRWPDRFNP